jgi:glycosyltransferase involved in cell wall biosynthesis
VRLGFDATSLTAAGKGVARFQREFLHAADTYGLVDELDVFVPLEPDEAALPGRAGWRYHRVPTAPMLLWEQVRRPALARRLGLDVLVTSSERAASWGPPQVMYVYEHPRHRVRRSREVGVSRRQRAIDLTTLGLFALARRRAAAVVAASHATAREIGAEIVVHSGVSDAFSPAEGPRTYFLHLASDDPRDNSEVAVAAYGRLGPDAPPLVVAGPIARSLPALQARAAEAPGRVEWRGFQSGAALVDLYRGAIAYVDPSLYEGFGLQAAEALACGTPAIASNTTSLPEVVGDGGILLDPHDVDGFAAAMRRVANDRALAADLGRKAVAQASRFRWEATVRGLLDVCERIEPK